MLAKNTSYKIILDICEQIGYKFTHNKKTDELFKIAGDIINKRSAVFVFDEIDKLEDFDFLYLLSEGIFRKSIILITNYKEVILNFDSRVKSRLTPETLEFEKYNMRETEGILKERINYAFYPEVWEEEAFEIIVQKTFELGDIRQGIYLLKESGRIAEDNSSRKVLKEHAEKAVEKLENFSIKKEEDLEEDTKLILDAVKSHSGKKIGDIYKVYKEKGGKNSQKTFQRKIAKLEQNKFVSTYKTGGGAEGNTTIVSYKK